MEEKTDYTAESELPLFSEENAEDTSSEQVQEEVIQSPAEVSATIPEETVVQESSEAEEVPAAAPAVSGSAGGKVPIGLTPTAEFGIFLRRAREANNISLDELSRITRIKKGYLEAVEQENYKELPAVVYALAYINTLADFYGVDAEGKAALTSEVRKHLAYEAPEENKTVIGYERSEENQILLRRILFAGAGMIVLLAVLITLAVLFFTSGGSESGGSGQVQGGAPAGLDEAQLVEIQPAPALQTHVLPVPKR